MCCASHAFGLVRETVLQAFKVDESSHEGRDLNRGSVDQGLDESFHGRERNVGEWLG